MPKQINHKQIEKANKANGYATLEILLESEYGAVYHVPDGLAVPIGNSPLDSEKQMWLVYSVTAKAIETHKWGKTTREYYDGYAEAEAFELEQKAKAEKAEKEKENKEKRVKQNKGQ